MLSVDALVRSIAVNGDARFGLFLGAGASVTSGVPTAADCVWQWKREIFLSKSPEVRPELLDISVPSTRARIQAWLDLQGGYPPLDDQSEYGFYIEKCYPIPNDRTQFFQRLTKDIKPHAGYKIACLLAQAGLLDAVWTTNFDRLMLKAASATDLVPIEVGLDSVGRIRPTSDGELLCVALHGDYRYDDIKNTPAELREQDAHLRKALIDYAKNRSLLVIGYSGRDESVVSALTEAFTSSGTGRLYWCGCGESEPNAVVHKLLNAAREAGRYACYINGNGFDDLMFRLSGHCLKGDALTAARQVAATSKSPTIVAPFAIDGRRPTGLIKSNAFRIRCPKEAFEISLSQAEQDPWGLINRLVGTRSIVAAPFKGKILALGDARDIEEAFRDVAHGALTRTPISDSELGMEHGVISSLIRRGLVRAVAAAAGLSTDGSKIVWDATSHEQRVVKGQRCVVHEAALLYLRRYGGQSYVVLKPTIRVLDMSGNAVDRAVEEEAKRNSLTRQYNYEFNEAANKWRGRLFGSPTCVFCFPPSTPTAFKYEVDRIPLLTEVCREDTRKAIVNVSSWRGAIAHKAVEIEEPKLVFASRTGHGVVMDTHPIRGIVKNRPFDYGLTEAGLAKQISIGVICPPQDANNLNGYLGGLDRLKQPNSKAEYLLPYPGFAQVFGLPLTIPIPNSDGWAACPEPRQDSSPMEVGQSIVRCVEALEASQTVNVIVVYVPARWEKWERKNGPDESYDLHDFVKAACVQKGIATQFLREATLEKPYQGEINWWLALALYAKSMRTPWVLESMDNNTAFVGLGFSIDKSAPRGAHVVIGCSHIYSADGQGLRYRVSRLEDPYVDRRGNPFMSRDDARRVGESIREQFLVSRGQLPRRVVLHKRTPFRSEEREGLLEGLSNVEVVDMLEISADPALRYVASAPIGGKLQADRFPVRRGTTQVLDSDTALVWVHGSSDGIQPAKRYYQGKSRIPAPLLVKRFNGTSSIQVLASEILGLSKMNWNTFDLYSHMPATIESSNAIARIGRILNRFIPASFDYRLFI